MQGVSVAGHYELFMSSASAVERRLLSDDALLAHIKEIYAQSRCVHSIRAKGKRRFKVTTDGNHALPIVANLLDRQFNVAQLDKARLGDITYISTDEGWLFLD